MTKIEVKNAVCAAIDKLEIPENLLISEILKILSEYNGNDFECVEKIVTLLEKHGYDCGGCHDF